MSEFYVERGECNDSPGRAGVGAERSCVSLLSRAPILMEWSPSHGLFLNIRRGGGNPWNGKIISIFERKGDGS